MPCSVGSWGWPLHVDDPVRTAFLSTSTPNSTFGFGCAFEIDEWPGDVAPADGDIKQAAFFPLPDALKLLGELDSATQRETISLFSHAVDASGRTVLSCARPKP